MSKVVGLRAYVSGAWEKIEINPITQYKTREGKLVKLKKTNTPCVSVLDAVHAPEVKPRIRRGSN